MAATDPTKDLSELVDGGTIVMLMTMIDGDHSSRPLTVAGVQGGRIEILVDRTADWAQTIGRAGTVVHVSVADVRKNVYLSLNGSASISTDKADIERLWNPGGAAFFEGKDDPVIGVLRFDVADGEYWDSPSGRLGSAVALLKAAVGGDDAAGDHGRVGTD
jgi:general stress protein 26